jgi:predicted Zn-dependent protease
MAAGTLESFTRRAVGWNVPEAWYFLAKATGLQGRRERQRECLAEALRLEEGRPIRSLAVAFPPCL